MNSFSTFGNIVLLVERFSRRSSINKKQKQLKQKQLSWFSKSSGICFYSDVGVEKQKDKLPLIMLPASFT